MNLVRVGNHVVNLANMSDAHVSDDRVKVYFGDVDTGTVFEGEEAAALARHLRDLAIDLIPATPEDKEYAEYRQRGGELNRDEWQRRVDTLKSYHTRGEGWWQQAANRERANALETELKL